MKRILDYTITNEYENYTIREFLTEKGYPKGLRAHLFRTDGVLFRNGEAGHSSDHLKVSDKLKIILEESMPESYPAPENIPLSILYEDEDLLAVNKPAGMPIHPSINNYDNTLANALAYYFHEQKKPFIFRCTNRLDRDTSGVTIISKNLLCSGILASMVMKQQVHRQYLAIVRGSLFPESGTINAPLGRKPGSIIERTVDYEQGEPAVTHYQVVKKENGPSLISLYLETGRTHQIRIHMKSIGSPLIGDYLYNPDMEWIRRQALHSHKMSFLHPITRKYMEFMAPMPEDMQRIISYPI